MIECTTFGSPGATVEYDANPFTDADYCNPQPDTFEVMFTAGCVGHEASAVVDVLGNGIYVDIGAIVWTEAHPTLVHDGVPVLFNGDTVYFYRGAR